MAEENIQQIRGRAVPQPTTWLKRPEDVKPCGIAGCEHEGMYIPYVTVWAKGDKRRTGRYVVAIIQITLCTKHAVTDPKEYKPDAKMVAKFTKELEGSNDVDSTPDLENMVVQFYGNTRCRVDRTLDLALAAQGTFEPPKVQGATKVSP